MGGGRCGPIFLVAPETSTNCKHSYPVWLAHCKEPATLASTSLHNTAKQMHQRTAEAGAAVGRYGGPTGGCGRERAGRACHMDSGARGAARPSRANAQTLSQGGELSIGDQQRVEQPLPRPYTVKLSTSAADKYQPPTAAAGAAAVCISPDSRRPTDVRPSAIGDHVA